MTPQQIADHELRVWQERRHLRPIYRMIDVPPLVPEQDSDEYERGLDVLQAVMVS